MAIAKKVNEYRSDSDDDDGANEVLGVTTSTGKRMMEISVPAVTTADKTGTVNGTSLSSYKIPGPKSGSNLLSTRDVASESDSSPSSIDSSNVDAHQNSRDLSCNKLLERRFGNTSDQIGCGDEKEKRFFWEDYPIASYTEWTQDFKKTVHDVLVSKVFPYVKFVQSTDDLKETGCMAHIFDLLGHAGSDSADKFFRCKYWTSIAEYTKQKIGMMRNNVIGDCRKILKCKWS
jgi:hypothetical protein